MAIQLIENKKTNERGYQARWKGKTKYYSSRKMGDETAKELATLAEYEMVLDNPPSVADLQTRGCVNHFSLKRETPGSNGTLFLWKEYSSGKRYPILRGHYKDERFIMGMVEASIRKHGVYGACCIIKARKDRYGYPCLPPDELANLVLQWLKDTHMQHKNNLSLADIPDIDERGNLLVEELETKTIVVLGATAPSVNVLKQENNFYYINWVTVKGGDLNRAKSAVKHDTTSATKTQRLSAAESLMLVAIANEADGYFVPVSDNLSGFVQKLFKENDLPIVVSGCTVEHGVTIVYK